MICFGRQVNEPAEARAARHCADRDILVSVVDEHRQQEVGGRERGLGRCGRWVTQNLTGGSARTSRTAARKVALRRLRRGRSGRSSSTDVGVLGGARGSTSFDGGGAGGAAAAACGA